MLLKHIASVAFSAGIMTSCCTKLAFAVDKHDDKVSSALEITLRKQGFTGTVESSLTKRLGRPIDNMLARIDPLLANPVRLSETEFQDLYYFLAVSLCDTRARRENFCTFIPERLPSNVGSLMYGGVYIGAAILWLWAVDGVRPTVWDLAGAGVALMGMAIIFFQPQRVS